jgi:hypothetical protein
MVALTVTVMVLGGAIAAMIQGNRMISDARDTTRVSQIIQSEVESMRTLTWADLSAMTNPSYPTYPNYRQVSLQGQFAAAYSNRYTLWRGVFFEDKNGDGVYEQIGAYVYVGWRPAKGTSYRFERYYTRFTENGLNDYYYRAF